MIKMYYKALGQVFKYRGITAFLLLLGSIGISVASFVLGLLIPSLLVSFLTVADKFNLLLGALLFLALLNFIEPYIGQQVSKLLFLFRINEVARLNQKAIDFPVSLIDTGNGKDIIYAAQKAVSHGNDQGLEAFLMASLEFLKYSLTVVAYFLILSQTNIWVLLIFSLVSLLRIYLEKDSLKDTIQANESLANTYNLHTRIKHTCVDREAGKDIRLFNFSDLLRYKFNKINDQLNGFIKKRERNRLKGETIHLVLSSLRNLFFIIYLIKSLGSQLSVSEFILFLSVILTVDSLLSLAQSSYNKMKTNLHFVRDYFQAFDLPSYKDQVREVDIEDFQEIKSKDLSFSYTGDLGNCQLKEVNLVIKKGQRIALVGENGSGKTTLTKCLAGLYTPSKGQLLFNSINIEAIKPEALFKVIATEFQESFLFAGTIAENISCLPAGKIDYGKLDEVVEKTGFIDVVRNLEKGLQTELTNWLNPEGIWLSGGQTQKLMLARVLYKDADFIILDEPSAALDPNAEALLYQSINRLFKDKTILFVSHRLSSTQFCDLIYVLAQGKIVESGNHKELMAKEGLYTRMYGLQSSYYKEQGHGQ